MKYKIVYEEQFNRIKRLKKNIEQFSIATDNNFEEAIDTFTSFFIQCYHLRDWIIKSGFDKNFIDDFISQNIWLSLCRDLANKQKHQSIDKYIPNNDFVDFRVGVSTPISRYYDYFDKKSRFGIDVWGFGTPIDVVEVADRCIGEWKKLIKKLIIQKNE